MMTLSYSMHETVVNLVASGDCVFIQCYHQNASGIFVTVNACRIRKAEMAR